MCALYLSQIRLKDSSCAVVLRDGLRAQILLGVSSTYEVASHAISAGRSLKEQIDNYAFGDVVDLEEVASEGRFLPPITHPDPARWYDTSRVCFGASLNAREV